MQKVKAKMEEKQLLQKSKRKAVKILKNLRNLLKNILMTKGSAVNGGDLGFFPRKRSHRFKPLPTFTFSLKPDTVSEVVVSGNSETTLSS